MAKETATAGKTLLLIVLCGKSTLTKQLMSGEEKMNNTTEEKRTRRKERCSIDNTQTIHWCDLCDRDTRASAFSATASDVPEEQIGTIKSFVIDNEFSLNCFFLNDAFLYQ